MASPTRPISPPGPVGVPEMSPSVPDGESTASQGDEVAGASRQASNVSETQLRSMPGACPVDAPSPRVPSVAGLRDSALPRAVRRVQSLMAEENRFAETSYVSLDAIAIPRHRLQGGLLSDPEDTQGSLSNTLETALEVSIPNSIQSTLSSEPKVRIHFIRHAQAAHNIRNLLEGYSIENPTLTPLGRKQCEIVRKTFPHMNKITHILCSPLARTLETALACFKPIFERGVKIVAWSQLIEFGRGPTNKGDSVAVLKNKMEGKPVDVGYLADGWELAANRHGNDNERARRVAQTLYSFCKLTSRRGENPTDTLDVDLLVISHGSFLRQLLREDPKFANCQVRSCEFASNEQMEKGASHYDLFETEESKRMSNEVDWNSLEDSINQLRLSEEGDK